MRRSLNEIANSECWKSCEIRTSLPLTSAHLTIPEEICSEIDSNEYVTARDSKPMAQGPGGMIDGK